VNPSGAGGGLVARAGILLIFLAYAAPLLLIVLASFKTDFQIVNDPAAIVFHPTFEAYRAVFTGQFVQGVANSLVIAGGATLLTLAVGVPLTYVLARAYSVWGGVVIGVLIVLQMTPEATSVIPQFKILSLLGLLGTRFGVILAMSAAVLPYGILILRPFVLSVPVEVEEAAQIDGAGRLRTFALIVFPLMRNGVSLLAVLLFIGEWGDFLYPLSYLNDQTQFPLSVLLLEQQGYYGTQWNNLMALAILGAIPTIVIFTLVARRLTSGLALGVGK